MPPLDGIALLDHHCHGVVTADLDRAAFESLLTEAPGAGRRDRFDSLLGLAVRRWCPPVLDLEPLAPPEEYLRRRRALGWAEVTRRMLRASGARTWLVDTGLATDGLTTPAELAGLGGGQAYPVTRLEAIAERAGARAGAGDWADKVERAVRAESAHAVGLKTVVAYRSGLAVPAAPPSPAAVAHAAGLWLRGTGSSGAVGASGRSSSGVVGASGRGSSGVAGASGTGGPGGRARIADPVLGAWLVHLGVRLSAELGLPLQVHTGFGDPDLRLHTANPVLLTDLLAASERSGAQVMLLHCWPYLREAGYLAHVFEHVHLDAGLAVPYVGVRAPAVLAELFELAPFASVCFSSDGYGLPELHYLGALLWRRALDELLERLLRDQVLTQRDATRLVTGIAHRNARAVYPLPTPEG